MEKLVEREKLKQKLESIGINPILLQMPSVLERVYEKYESKTESEVEECILNGQFKVSSNGDFSFNDGKENYDFKFDKDNSTAVLTKQIPDSKNKVISIDKYGMDSSLSIEDSSISVTMGLPDGSSICRIEELNIMKFDNYGIDSGSAIHIDGGSYNIEESAIKDGKIDTWKETWNQNREFLVQNYPLTADWFETRESLKDATAKSEEKSSVIVEEPSDEIEKSRKLLAEATERIATLTEENKDKDAEIESLKSDKNKLQSMLNRSLKLCEDVKRSWVGKVFFKNQLNKLNEGQEEER